MTLGAILPKTLLSTTGYRVASGVAALSAIFLVSLTRVPPLSVLLERGYARKVSCLQASCEYHYQTEIRCRSRSCSVPNVSAVHVACDILQTAADHGSFYGYSVMQSTCLRQCDLPGPCPIRLLLLMQMRVHIRKTPIRPHLQRHSRLTVSTSAWPRTAT